MGFLQLGFVHGHSIPVYFDVSFILYCWFRTCDRLHVMERFKAFSSRHSSTLKGLSSLLLAQNINEVNDLPKPLYYVLSTVTHLNPLLKMVYMVSSISFDQFKMKTYSDTMNNTKNSFLSQIFLWIKINLIQFIIPILIFTYSISFAKFIYKIPSKISNVCKSFRQTNYQKLMETFQQPFLNITKNQHQFQQESIEESSLSDSINIFKRRSQAISDQTVQVYLKSKIKKSMKIKVEKNCKIQKIKRIIEEEMQIPCQDQIIYINGREISSYISITLNPKQILHISNRKCIVGQNQSITINLIISTPIESLMINKTLCFQLIGKDKVKKLEDFISQLATFQNPENIFQSNFLSSGRILQKDQSFKDNLLTNNCEVVCLISQNQVETKFINEFQDFTLQECYIKENKHPKNQNQFIIDNQDVKTYANTKRKSGETFEEIILPKMNKIKSNSDIISNGFKKKKHYEDDWDTSNSPLITKIVVHKSKNKVQKFCSESSIFREQAKDKENEKKSDIASSSQEQENEQISMWQQKKYRPYRLIPQRKMAQSQKLKINIELQKLFGQEFKTNLLQDNQNQIKTEQISQLQQCQSVKSCKIVDNANMRNFISSKQSTRKVGSKNRYAQEKMYEGD